MIFNSQWMFTHFNSTIAVCVPNFTENSAANIVKCFQIPNDCSHVVVLMSLHVLQRLCLSSLWNHAANVVWILTVFLSPFFFFASRIQCYKKRPTWDLGLLNVEQSCIFQWPYSRSGWRQVNTTPSSKFTLQLLTANAKTPCLYILPDQTQHGVFKLTGLKTC